MNIELMRDVERFDPVYEGIFVTRSWETIDANEESIIMKANIGPGVDVFIKHTRDGEISELLVRAAGETYSKAKKIIDESGETPTRLGYD